MGIKRECVRFVQEVRVLLLRWPRNLLCSQRRPSHVYAWAIRWPLRSRKLTGTERGGRPWSTTASSHVYYFTLFKVLSRCRSRKLTDTERGGRPRSTTASSHVFTLPSLKLSFEKIHQKSWNLQTLVVKSYEI